MSTYQTSQTPWADWSEWAFVRESLLPPGGRVGEALEVVEMWRSRGGLPHAVDSTALLVEVMLRDREGLRSESELRLAYAMVVVRTVNGLVDPSQQGYYAEPVSLLASRIGLPQWLVELRHDATHSQLPTLIVLRSAADCLLLWLNDNYWLSQFSFLEETSRLCVPTTGRLAAKDHKVHQDLVFGARSTVLTNLFLPMLLRGAVIDQAEDLIQLHALCEQSWELWAQTLSLGIEHNLQGAHTIICGLISFALNRSDKVPMQRLEYVVFSCSFWVQKILEIVDSFDSTKIEEILGSERNQSNIEVVIASASEKNSSNRTHFDGLLNAVGIAYGLTPLCEGGTLDRPFEFRRSLFDSLTNKTAPINKRNRILGKTGPQPLGRVCWPLGCVPGSTSVDELYTIEIDDSFRGTDGESSRV